MTSRSDVLRAWFRGLTSRRATLARAENNNRQLTRENHLLASRLRDSTVALKAIQQRYDELRELALRGAAIAYLQASLIGAQTTVIAELRGKQPAAPEPPATRTQGVH